MWDRPGYKLATLTQQAQMVRYTLSHMLRPSLRDWYRNREHAIRLWRRWWTGGFPALQRPNAEVAFLSTPRDGLGIGLTEHGRISVVFGPTPEMTHQLPYYVSGSDEPLGGAAPMAGSFAGLDRDTGVDWLWENAESITYTGPGQQVSLEYSGPVPVTERSYVVPGTETLVRDYGIENPTSDSIELEFVYHTRANVNTEPQHFGAWCSRHNELTASEELCWDEPASETGLWICLDRDARATARNPNTGMVRRHSSAAEFSSGTVSGGPLDGRLRTTLSIPPESEQSVSVFLTAGENPTWDERLLAKDPETRQQEIANWWNNWVPDGVLSEDDSIPDGVLLQTDELLPNGDGSQTDELLPNGDGSQTDELLPNGDGSQTDELLPNGDSSQTDELLPNSDGSQMDELLPNSDSSQTDESAGSDRLTATYRRSLAVLGALADPVSGSIPASPNLQPTYYPCWPRDSAFAAVALARAGRPEPARALLADFLPRVQEPDGSFRQCYDSAGWFVGAVHLEADQQPLYVWAVAQVGQTVGNGFLRSAWPAVRDALRYIQTTISGDGLLEPTPDIDEWPDSVRKSLWTNVWAYRAFRDGASIAREIDASVDPRRFDRTADRIGTAIERELFSADGYVTYRDANGEHEDLHTYDSVAISPTGWASEYGETDRLYTDLRDLATEEPTWMPGAGLLAVALYDQGDHEIGDALLERIATKTTAAGHLVEAPAEDTDHYYASPLAWSHAAFVLAMQARKRTREDRRTSATNG